MIATREQWWRVAIDTTNKCRSVRTKNCGGGGERAKGIRIKPECGAAVSCWCFQHLLFFRRKAAVALGDIRRQDDFIRDALISAMEVLHTSSLSLVSPLLAVSSLLFSALPYWYICVLVSDWQRASHACWLLHSTAIDWTSTRSRKTKTGTLTGSAAQWWQRQF